MGLRFCCEMCGWGKRSLFCAGKMITYHFSVLVLSLSKWICSQQCHRVSLEMFFIVSEGLSGAMLWAQPRGLAPSHRLPQSPLGFLQFFWLLTQFGRCFSPCGFGAEGEEHSVHFCHLSQPLLLSDIPIMKSWKAALLPQRSPAKKTATKGFKVFHLFTLQHRDFS